MGHCKGRDSYIPSLWRMSIISPIGCKDLLPSISSIRLFLTFGFADIEKCSMQAIM